MILHRSWQRIAQWAAGVAVLTQVGCAATPTPGHPPDTITFAGTARQQECAEFAGAVATAGREAAMPLTESVLTGTLGLAVARPDTLVLLPVLPFVAFPVVAVELTIHAVRDRRVRGEIRQDALRACLEPPRLAAALGPDHPDVADSLARLAARRAALERRQAEVREQERAWQASHDPPVCNSQEIVHGRWQGGLRPSCR
jgi:hypothetical protein